MNKTPLSLSERDRMLQSRELRLSEWLVQVDEQIRTEDPWCKAFIDWRLVTVPADSDQSPVTVTYKDIIDVAGFPTRLGNPYGYRRYPSESAWIARALARRHTVTLGKVATTECGIGATTPCINPLYPHFSPSGSSTGSAVSVAAGFCDLSVGTDTGGSTRWPAGSCGVVGMRLTPRPEFAAGILPVSPHMDSIGLVTRTSHDLGYMWERERLGDLLVSGGSSAAQQPGTIRFGLVANVLDGPCDPEILRALATVVTALRYEGLTVTETRLAWWQYREIAWHLLWREVYDVHKPFGSAHSFRYEQTTTEIIDVGGQVTDAQYAKLLLDQKRVMTQAQHDLTDGVADVLLLPLDPELPWDRRVPPPETPAVFPAVPEPGYTIAASFAGIPALTLPMGQSASGAPIGLQLWARHGADTLLIQAGMLIESIMRRALHDSDPIGKEL